jgi:tetratricopeptide (TPR) repeat protein
MKMYSREFQLLHDEIGVNDVADTVTARRDYLEGKLAPWIGVARRWTFLRPKCKEVEDLVLKSLQSRIESEVPVLLLHGPAGAGKSTIARVVAHSIYRSQGIPTIFLHPENDQVDYIVIDSLSRQIEGALTAANQTKGRRPTLIVIDEAAAHIQDVRRLPQYLASRGIPALVLAVARENEWGVARGEQPLSHVIEVPVSDSLDTNASEPLALVRHLRGLDVLVSSQADNYWEARIAREYDNSFATTLYQLAEPTRPPLTKAIRDEYDKLSPLAKQAYRYVCAFYQFSIPLDLELLARSLGCSYERFIESVYHPATIGVIVEDVSGTSDIRFRARSRLVAERVVAYVYRGETAWLEDVCSVIRACLPHNGNEVKTIRNMLIHRIGPRGAEPKDLSAVTAAFQAALDGGIRDSAMLHHFALLLMDQEQFDDADHYAQDALAVLDDSHVRVHFKTESRQNLHNTLGMIAAKHGLKQASVGAADRASALFEEAVTHFHSARAGEFANAYPFYSEAWMLYQRARSVEGINAVVHIAQAFQVLDEAEGNVADDDMASISEMEAKLVRFLSEFENLKATLQSLLESNAPTAIYLEARYATAEGGHGYSREHAYGIVTASLANTPDHVPCLRLACNLHHALYPQDFSGWKAMLDRLLNLEVDRRQCSTLFSLGYAACQLGRYNEAQLYFEELEQESTGHPRRARIVNVVKDGEKDRRLTGRVIAVRSPTEGWLKSDEIATDLKFIARAQKFTVNKGVTVTFALALNYRGFLAIDLRPA